VKVTTLINDNSGDAVVEAAFLFPVMILILAALAVLAAYLPTKAALQHATQHAATALATELSDTWLVCGTDSQTYYWIQSKSELKNVYAALFSGTDELLSKGYGLVLEDEKNAISSKAGTLSVQSNLVNRIIYKEVVVTASRDFPFLDFLSLAGFPQISVSVTSTAVVQNADEFIRDLDMCVDFLAFVKEKFGFSDASDTIGTFGNRLSSVLGWP